MGRLTGERRALAAAFLAMYGFLYLLLALQAPAGLGPALGALSGVYALAFLGIVAGYFWARWFAIGVGISHFIIGSMTLFQLGELHPVFVFYTLTNGAVSLLLWGNGMAKLFDGREEWRKRFHLDESATNRLGKSVIRVGVSLPYVLLYALAPREGAALAMIGGVAIVGGVWALFKLRSWAIPALAAGTGAIGISLIDGPSHSVLSGEYALNLGLTGAAALVMTALALAPFVAPVTRFLFREAD
jgi:hypothetical protein